MPLRTPGDFGFYDKVKTGMVDGFMIDRATLALSKCMDAKMSKTKWLELGLELGKRDIIEDHPRLLRSLQWGDSDYGAAIIEVLPDLMGTGLENLQYLEDFLELPDWLERREKKLYAELYADGPEATVSVAVIEEAAAIHGVADLKRHITRILASIDEDPEQAIGSAKEMLESVLKTIIGDDGVATSDDVPTLVKKVRTVLDLDPQADTKAGEITKRTLSNLVQVIVGVAEVRNLHGTGHGRVRAPMLDAAHTRLVVNAAITVATFLLEVKGAS